MVRSSAAMVARSAGFAVSLVAAIVSSRARDIRSLTDFITPSACDTSAEAALMFDDQAVMLAGVVPIVAIRRAATGTSDIQLGRAQVCTTVTNAHLVSHPPRKQ